MTSLGTVGWPADDEGRAVLARDASRSQDDRQRALGELQPTVRRIARRVAVRYGGAGGTDTVEEALGVVWQALEGYEAGRPFEAWCYGVLKNHLIDWVRKEQSEWRRRGEVTARRSMTLQRALEQSIDQPSQLTEDDLTTLRAWPLPQRLALLSLCGLSDKVPPAEWQNWVQQYQEMHDAGLSLPFPPEALRAAEAVSRRNEILAEALGIRRNTLSVWLYRYKDRVRGLDYVRELLDPTDGSIS